MGSFFRKFSAGFVPREAAHVPDLLRQTNRAVAFHLAMLIWVPVFAIVYSVLGAPISSNIILSGGVLLLGNLMLLRRGNTPEASGNMLSFIAWYVYTSLAILTGGAGAPVMVWYASIPVLSSLLSGTRSGNWWTIVSVLTIASFAAAREAGFQFPLEVSPAGMRFLQFSGVVGIVCCVYLLVCVLKGVEHNAREALHEANHRLEMQASMDCLTGIPNRRTFDQVLEMEWKRHQRTAQSLSIALIDADFFKQFNDVRGHLAGDDCLRLIAEAIQASIRRPGDFAARYGGEEFAVVLPETDDAGAAAVAEALRLAVKELAIPHPTSTVSPYVTISVGYSTAVPGGEQIYFDLLKDADAALYRAKANGRDQSVYRPSLATV